MIMTLVESSNEKGQVGMEEKPQEKPQDREKPQAASRVMSHES